MKRQRLVLGLVFAAIAFASARPATADPPDLLTPYRFVPRESTLIASSATPAADFQYTVFGRFDLASIWEYLDDPPTISIHHYYAFDNVQAFAANPLTAAAPLDLDKVLNLSGLTGTLLPVASPFDVIKFEGKTADGSAVNLFASLLGNWLYLHGGTTPPSAAGTSYQIKALAREQPFADFNDDATVDGLDLTAWMDHVGPSPAASGDLTASGDANLDGVVDGTDFLVWQQQLGETAPSADSLGAMITAALAAAPSIKSAPEPTTVGLAWGALMLLAVRRRVL